MNVTTCAKKVRYYMGSYQIKKEILDALTAEISNNNAKLLETLEGKTEILNTVEFIKILYSDNLLEDIELINKMSGNELFKLRHANIIMRDMLEQVIEFIYLMKHPEIISEYFGANVDTSKISSNNPLKGMHKLGNERFVSGRKTVSAMAQEINEKKSNTNQLALYELYQLLSEECHNSYFFASLDGCEEVATGTEILPLSEYQVQNIVIIIDRFMEVYRK